MYASTIKAQKDGRPVAARRLDAVVVPPISSFASSRRPARPCGQPLPHAHVCGPWMRRARPSHRDYRSRQGISGRRSSHAFSSANVHSPTGDSVSFSASRISQATCLAIFSDLHGNRITAYSHPSWSYRASRTFQNLPTFRTSSVVLILSFSDGAYLHLSTHRVPQAACAVNYYFSGLPRGVTKNGHNPGRQPRRECGVGLDGVVLPPDSDNQSERK